MTKTQSERADAIGKTSQNLEKVLETISRRILQDVKTADGAQCKELGELAKVMKQAAEIRQELRGGKQEDAGVRVVFAAEAEGYAQ